MNELEQTLRDAERILRERQVCTYYKIPNDMRLTEDQLIFGGRGPCDFIGHTVRGRAILIEAKMRDRKSLGIGNQSKDIKGHQWMALRDAAAAGCVSLILWQRKRELAVLPFALAQELRAGRRSIPWPGGQSLETDEPALVVVAALVEVLDPLGEPVDVRRQVPDRR